MKSRSFSDTCDANKFSMLAEGTKPNPFLVKLALLKRVKSYQTNITYCEVLG